MAYRVPCRAREETMGIRRCPCGTINTDAMKILLHPLTITIFATFALARGSYLVGMIGLCAAAVVCFLPEQK